MRLFFVLIALPFFALFPYLRAVNNPNELVRVFTTMSLVEDGTLAIDEEVATYGWVNDMAHVPSKFDGGKLHYFMVKTPLSTYLGVPVYYAYSKVQAVLGHHHPDATSGAEAKTDWLRRSTWVLRLFTVQLPCFLFLIFFERYLRTFVPDVVLRLATVTAAGLGTNYLAYSQIYASHTLYACAAFLCFAITERAMREHPRDARARKWTHAFLVGFLAGACVAFEYHALFVAVVLSIFGVIIFRRPTQILALALGGLIPAAIVAHFQWRAYGDPLKPGHQVLETASFAAAHQKGLFGVQLPAMDALKSLSMDIGFGFFSMSPFMWFALVVLPCTLLLARGTPLVRRSQRVAGLVLTLVLVSMFGVAAGIVEWRGGWTVGPRYLAGAPPTAAFAAALVLQTLARRGRAWRAMARGIAGGLAIAGVLSIGVVGLVYDTLPEALPRPLTQFALPATYLGFVPHHIGEWFGWMSATPWYLVCFAMFIAVAIAVLLRDGEGPKTFAFRLVCLVVAAVVGTYPAFTRPEDKTTVLALHPSVAGLASYWEPTGRDRITLGREDAERYGPRRPCVSYRLGDLDRIAGRLGDTVRDEARAKAIREDSCTRDPYLVALESLSAWAVALELRSRSRR
ncbi:MAG: hypothetical protein JWM74_4875 [Myxococcaceae bacterium]|nr:hypothetical protein [Myxococcaceae bacterium]